MPIYRDNRPISTWFQEICDTLNVQFEDMGCNMFAHVNQDDSGVRIDVISKVVDEYVMFSIIGGDFGLPWLYMYETTYTEDGVNYLAPALHTVYKTVFEEI